MKVERYIKELLGIVSEVQNIKCSKTNLEKHPDYVGMNPNEKSESIEYVKIFEDNVLVALKIHGSKDFYYIPSMYTITDYKLQSRLFSGRLKKVDNKNNKP